MEAKELRIGNLILRDDYEMVVYHIEKKHHNVFKVNDLDIDFSDEIQVNKLCSPIPLTVEWLLRLGFIGCVDDEQFEKDGFIYDIWRHIKIDTTFEFDKFYLIQVHHKIMKCCRQPIEHVHQLQNLYYALTGEELEIKE